MLTVTVLENPDNPFPAGISIDTAADSDTVVIRDIDPTVVSLARVGTGAVFEGEKAAFTVTLGRSLEAGEVIDVPLSVSGAGVLVDVCYMPQRVQQPCALQRSMESIRGLFEPGLQVAQDQLRPHG